MDARPQRAQITRAAADLLETLQARYGALMFHQSGGCCDGSSPMCYPDGDFIVGDRDVLRAIRHLPDYGAWPLSDAPLATTPEGRLVLLKENGEIYALSARGWQLMSVPPEMQDVRLRLRRVS